MSKFLVTGEFTYYIVALVPEKEGNFSVYVPDVPEVIAGGATIPEAIESAVYGLRVVFQDMLVRGDRINEPTTMENIVAAVKRIREEDELPYPDGIIYQYVKAPIRHEELIKFEIELPANLVSELDDAVRSMNTSRSTFIKAALRGELGENFW